MKKKLFKFFLIFALLIIVGFYYQYGNRSSVQPEFPSKRVLVIDRKVSNFNKKLRMFAKLYSSKSIDVIAEVDGTIESRNYEIGDFVNKDDVILKMKDTRKLLELKEAEDLLNSHKSRLDEAARNYKNAISLYGKEIISSSELDTKKNLFNQSKSEHDAQEARYKKVLWEFHNLNVVAPFNGYINKFYQDVGQKVTRGKKLFKYVDNSYLIGKSKLSSDNARKILRSSKIIQAIKEDETFSPEIIGISRKIDKETVTYVLEFKIDNSSDKFIPGEVIEIEIEIEKFENYIAIPSKAILNEGSKSFIFIETNGKAKKINIKPILLNSNESIVEAESIPELTRIIVEGYSGLEDGNKVKVIK
tara:strand:- start:5086 stop:6165 length:1080 start_codon:yes stop_codon:yes gene_type:complete